MRDGDRHYIWFQPPTHHHQKTFLTCPLPVLYPSGLPRPHKGQEQTLYLISATTTHHILEAYIAPLLVPYASLNHPPLTSTIPNHYSSFTYTLPIPWPTLNHPLTIPSFIPPLPIPYMSLTFTLWSSTLQKIVLFHCMVSSASVNCKFCVLWLLSVKLHFQGEEISYFHSTQ